MSLKNEDFLNGVKEIIHQKTIIEAAKEHIRDIKKRLEEEKGFSPTELNKYATQYFKKLETPTKFGEEMDLSIRIYEEVDEIDI